MMNIFDQDETKSREDAKVRLEAQRMQGLFTEVFETVEGKEALEILGRYFEVHVPSGPASGFQPHQAFYMDGQKSVFKTIRDIIEGEFHG